MSYHGTKAVAGCVWTWLVVVVVHSTNLLIGTALCTSDCGPVFAPELCQWALLLFVLRSEHLPWNCSIFVSCIEHVLHFGMRLTNAEHCEVATNAVVLSVKPAHVWLALSVRLEASSSVYYLTARKTCNHQLINGSSITHVSLSAVVIKSSFCIQA